MVSRIRGLLAQYLGIEVEQAEEHITIRQSKYARGILETFGYDRAQPEETNARLAPLDEKEESDTEFPYRQAIGMLMYLAMGTRPDLAFVVGQLSRFVSKPSAKHVGTLKRVLRYLAGTVNYGIMYDRAKERPSSIVMEGYCDSDWANDPYIRKKAEYVAVCEAATEAVAESNFLQELIPRMKVKPRIGIDNQAALVMATNPSYSRRTRHIELRWRYVREQVDKGVIKLYKVPPLTRLRSHWT
ncbi:hypothetical protein PC123_g5047 [Phytophthora cactorum]|nr:hypothetical protein PC123_g5047 [Phytophthora cactorum]